MSRKKLKVSRFALYSIVLVVSLLIVLLPVLLKLGSDGIVLISDLSTYHLALADNTLAAESHAAVNIFFSGPNLFHIIISKIGSASSPFPIIIFNALLGSFSALLVLLLSRQLFLSLTPALYAVLLFITSPMFLVQFSVINPSGLLLFLFLLSLYCFSFDSPYAHILSLVFSLMVLSMSPIVFIALLLMLFVLQDVLKNQSIGLSDASRSPSAPPFILALLLLFSVFFWFLQRPVLTELNVFSGSFPFNFFTDLGAFVGFGIFHVLLAVVGIFASWKLKKRYPLAYFGGLLLFFLSFTWISLSVLLNLIFCIFAGFGIHHMFSARWDSNVVKWLSSVLVFCGILFTFMSFAVHIVRIDPDAQALDFFVSAGKLSSEGDIFLSHQDYGLMITSISGRNAVLDPFSVKTDELSLNISNFIFQSRNYNNVANLLKQSGISYIVVSSDMKNGLTWDSEDDGLLFLLGRAPIFNRVFVSGDFELWQVNYSRFE